MDGLRLGTLLNDNLGAKSVEKILEPLIVFKALYSLQLISFNRVSRFLTYTFYSVALSHTTMTT